jgi:prepilin peptidase CpaA
MPLPDILRVTLVALACVAGVVDIRTRRIPNWLCAVGLAAGFAFQYYVHGPRGLLDGAEGMGLALLIYIPLWLLRGMGAGDAKLMAALGAIAGPGHWFVLFLVASILGGIAAAVVAYRHGRAASTIINTFSLARELAFFRAPWKALPQTDFRHGEALRIPHGAMIGGAALILAALGRL